MFGNYIASVLKDIVIVILENLPLGLVEVVFGSELNSRLTLKRFVSVKQDEKENISELTVEVIIFNLIVIIPI